MKNKSDFIKKARRVFKSIHLSIFIIILMTGVAAGVTVASAAYLTCREASIRIRSEEAQDYVAKLSPRLIGSVYFANPSNAPDITRELDIVAAMYDGRVTVIDSGLKIIYDSYGIEVGKTLISEESTRLMSGQKSEYRDRKNQTVELALPVLDTAEGANKVQGGIIIRLSVADCYKLSHSVNARIQLTSVLTLLALVGLGILISAALMRPFRQISQTIRHVSDGYIEDKVDITGFTEVEDISDSFNDMLGRISRIEESRQEFVSNVSHELKTPITSMKVLADSLLTQPDAPVEMYREFMEDINAEIDRESKIISDLLALVKLDRKEGDMHVAQVSINELIEMIMRRLKPIALEAGVELIYESYREVLAEVDEVKLSLAVTNLVENGIKYNRKDGWVKVSLNSDHKYFIIRVADSGIGIPEESLEHIFERFYRVDKMRARQTGGTGLGLSIARNVVLMHKGTIKVESTEGEGTSFIVRIPMGYIHGKS